MGLTSKRTSKADGRAGSALRQLLPFFIVLVALASVFVASGCGSDDNNDTTGASGTAGASTAAGAFNAATVKTDPAVADQVPAAVKNKGTLVVAMDASYPPNEFFAANGKTIIGMDADLAKALGKTMGLDTKLQNATFDSILPGIASKKYDLGMSSFTDTKEREQTVDMVTYLLAGTKFYTAADGGKDINGLADLCGLTAAVERGTTQADDANAQSKKCKEAGKPAVKVDTFTDQNGANLAVTSKRADIGMADSPVAAYIIKQSGGKLRQTGNDYGEAPYGIALDKDSALTPAVLAAVKSLIANGHYGTVLKIWNLSDEKIDEPKINDGIE